MPLVEVTLAAGRDAATIRTLIDRVHHAVVDAVGAPPANIRVIVREVPPEHWAAGNETLAERYAARDRTGSGDE
ncbi:hypothetical protein SRB5_46850 [Streptomyces sp. RB5]|uniref:4-oxalocrotonate tautomerase-like domain-containing protein n=1 Tax=Streptomyces smaragdinus TaxID=2585196 RepID=A0A7K0CM10_9ACTN|nr:tautomerase family protein [Streptomyces smaragdinus]MQY14517.1 hypothetical protein [Streptomyces smaragdinus]